MLGAETSEGLGDKPAPSNMSGSPAGEGPASPFRTSWGGDAFEGPGDDAMCFDGLPYCFWQKVTFVCGARACDILICGDRAANDRQFLVKTFDKKSKSDE